MIWSLLPVFSLGMGGRAIGLAAAVGAAVAALPPAARWALDIKETEAAYATDKHAILKIDDAVYLKSGQKAWLIEKPGGAMAWRMAETKPSLLVAAYAEGAIRLDEASGQYTFFPADQGGALGWGEREVRAQYTQIAPNEMGVRLFAYNQNNPAAKAFKGLSYFPYAPAYVIEAPFRQEPAKPVDFQTSRGWWKRFWRVGTADFTLNGATVSLPLYAGEASGRGGLSAFFLDKTTGVDTYQSGRYLDVPGDAFPPKTVRLDFNYAYNPLCARTSHYNCPFATDVIATDVRAGEKAPERH